MRGRRVTRHNDIKLESAFSKDKQEPAIQMCIMFILTIYKVKVRVLKYFKFAKVLFRNEMNDL